MVSTKWGIASAGKISHDMVNAILALENTSDHEIVAVAARNLANAKEFAAKFKASANSFAPDGGQTLQKQVCFKA